MDKFEALGDFEGKYLELINIRSIPHYNKTWRDAHKIDIEQWNDHDYLTVIAFKNFDSWIDFCCALEGLEFYHKMYNNTDVFNIFFKSYNKDQIQELNKECSHFIREIYFDKILEYLDKGYVIFYLTTQRECHNKNHFLMDMLDNWRYSQMQEGHMWHLEIGEDKDIGYIILNEK